MTASLSSANEKAADFMAKVGEGTSAPSHRHSLPDTVRSGAGGGGSSSNYQLKPNAAGQISDSDLKAMFMSQYRKNKTSNASSPKTAPLQSGAAAPASPSSSVGSSGGGSGVDKGTTPADAI